jgi:hypothetical protein
MIFIVGEAFVNLRALYIREAPHNVVHGGTIDDQANHIVYANAGTFDNRVASAYVW